MVTPGTGKEGHTPESPHCTKSGVNAKWQKGAENALYSIPLNRTELTGSAVREKRRTQWIDLDWGCILEHIPLKLSWMKTVTEKSKLDLQLRTFCVKFDSSRLITVMDSSSYNNDYLFSNNLEGTWLLKKLCLMFTCPVHPKSCLTNWSAMIHWVSR